MGRTKFGLDVFTFFHFVLVVIQQDNGYTRIVILYSGMCSVFNPRCRPRFVLQNLLHLKIEEIIWNDDNNDDTTV